MKKIELLAPAGNLDKLKTAIRYGADAVYIGGKKFSLRARASNFDLDDIKEACAFAREYKAAIYVTMNIIPHNEDFDGLVDYLKFLESVGVRAIITSSVHIIDTTLKETSMEVHLSTQLSISNHSACNFYANMGVERIVLAREVSLQQIEKIQKNTKIGLEVFIHGGMCSSYSGRCMLSNHFVNRDANRGGCAHSCRWNYHLYDQNNLTHPQDMFFNMGAKDLVGISVITKLIDIGVDSLKIEGRMKSDYYIATVVRCYRHLIDKYYQKEKINYDYFYQEMAKAENRLSSTGFLDGDVSVEQQLYERSEHPTKEFVGIVLDYDNTSKIAKVEQRNYFEPRNELEFFGPNLENTKMIVEEIWDDDYNVLDAARHPKQTIYFKVPFTISKYDMIRLVTNI